MILISASEVILKSVVSCPITILELIFENDTLPSLLLCVTCPWICIPSVPEFVTVNSEPFELIFPIVEINILPLEFVKVALPLLLLIEPSTVKPLSPLLVIVRAEPSLVTCPVVSTFNPPALFKISATPF